MWRTPLTEELLHEIVRRLAAAFKIELIFFLDIYEYGRVLYAERNGGRMNVEE